MPLSLSLFNFAHSLVRFSNIGEYVDATPYTAMPYWLGQFAQASGNTLGASGLFGNMDYFAETTYDINEAQWGFEGVTNPGNLDEAEYNTVLLTPANFVWEDAPNVIHGNRDSTVLDDTLAVIDHALALQPDAQFVIYDSWPRYDHSTMGEYFASMRGEYHTWFETLHSMIQTERPELANSVQLIPISDVLGGVFQQFAPDLQYSDLFFDNDPHGTETMYFMAGLVSYTAMYGEQPSLPTSLPANFPPVLLNNFDAITDYIEQELQIDGFIATAQGEGTGNMDPDAIDDVGVTPEGEAITINLLENDQDNSGGDDLSILSVDDPVGGSVTHDGTSITFTPDAGVVGMVTFSYVVQDATTGATDTASVTITIEADDPPPPPTGDGFVAEYFALASVPASIDDLTLSGPADGTGLVTSFTTAASDDWLAGIATGGAFAARYTGRIAIDPDGTTASNWYGTAITSPDPARMTFTSVDTGAVFTVDWPGAASGASEVWHQLFDGEYDVEIIYLSDDGIQTLQVEIEGGFLGDSHVVLDTALLVNTAPPNQAPDAVDDAISTAFDQAIGITVLGNDTDPDGDVLSVSGTTDPTNGTISVDGAGVITYTPNAGFSGDDSFTYTVNDGNNGTDTANVTVTVEEDTPPPSTDMAPALAAGLEGLTEYSAQAPFINLFKLAKGWMFRGPDTGLEEFSDYESDMDALAAGLFDSGMDANGYITALPTGADFVETIVFQTPDAESVVLSDVHADGEPDQDYRLTFDGTGVIEVVVNGQVIDPEETNDHAFNFAFTLPDGADEAQLVVRIYETDPDDHIRNISVVREDNIALHEAGAVFNPEWVSNIEDIGSVRFMDWQFTNGSPISTWEERPTDGDFSYAWRGASVETMVALANELGVDPWFNMPHMATDDYFQRFAEYVAEHLDADLTARVEYSNEIWNGMFEQTQWAQAQAATRFGIDESFYATREFVAARSADMSLIWQDEFGQAGRSADTLEVVISGIGYYDENEIENVLNATRWRAEDPANRADLHLFDAYAANGYFGNEYGNGEEETTAIDWLMDQLAPYIQAAESAASAAGISPTTPDDSPNGAYYDFITDHLAASDAYAVAGALLYQQLNPDDPDNTQVVGGLPSLNDLAATWAEISTNLPDDISMIMYEGGTHLVRVSAGENRTNEVVLDQFFLDFNYSDHMTLLYEQLLDNWSAADGELFNAFVDVARPSAFGSWGNLRFLGDSTGRWDELIEYNQTDHGWNSSGAAAYENGETLIGDGAANQLEGGNDADFLLGLSGDDILNGGGGRDGLSGGGGADTLDGQDGTDVLVGGMGDDVLTGGTGGDDFAFATGDGADIITDFLPGQDRLVIDGSIVVDLLAAPDVLNLGLAVDADQNLVISFGAGDSITLLHSDDLEAAYPDLFTPPPIMTVVTGTSGKDTINTNFVDAEGDTITDEGQEIHGEAGSDRIYDGDGDDIVFGGAGNDSFYAGGGADVYDGGAGTDHVRYNYAGPNLIVDMNNPDNNTGIAAGDQYTSVERLSGSNHDDVLHLAAGMVAFGRNGDDVFYDSTGREIMKGSGGADTFVLMAGDGHQDRVVSFQVGQDVLDISSWGASSIDDLNIYQFVSGSGNAQNRAIVEFNGESLSLHSFDPVNIPLLSNDDFIFL